MMISSLPLLTCESSVFVKENPDRKKVHFKIIHEEVSFSHLLLPESWKKRGSHFDLVPLSGSLADNLEVQEHESVVVDDPELMSGKHRTVLNLPSFIISIIPYAKPSEVKKDINRQFKEKFPHVTITLTKMRRIVLRHFLNEANCGRTKDQLKESKCTAMKIRIKAELLEIMNKTKITKHNRKCVAGACLLLAVKFFDDYESKNMQRCIEAISDQLRVSEKDLVACELQVLVLLEFALLTKFQEVYPAFKRIESSL